MKWLSDLLFSMDRWYYGQERYFKVSTETLETKEETPHTFFEVLKGPFKGTIYCYTKLTYNEDGMTTFGYFVLKGNAKGNPKFQPIARKILLNIMWKVVNEDSTYQMGLKPGNEYEPDRESHIEEPDNERAVRKKGSSLFEE